jgi:hypothetical protein
MKFDHSSTLLDFIIKFGLSSRALFFFVIGSFIIYAGVSFDSDNAKDFDQVWTLIGDLLFGGFLLFVTALGLTSDGIY